MKCLIGLLALCTLAVPLAGATAYAQDKAEDPVAHGGALAQEFCGACHAVGRTGKSADKEAPPFRRLGNNFDLDDFLQRLQRGLSSGHPDMPEFKFDTADARAMRAYLRAIQN